LAISEHQFAIAEDFEPRGPRGSAVSIPQGPPEGRQCAFLPARCPTAERRLALPGASSLAWIKRAIALHGRKVASRLLFHAPRSVRTVSGCMLLI
jgi:hypothetical protein